MAQSAMHRTLDLSSGLDLRGMSSGPTLGFVLGVRPTLKLKKKKSTVHSLTTSKFISLVWTFYLELHTHIYNRLPTFLLHK